MKILNVLLWSCLIVLQACHYKNLKTSDIAGENADLGAEAIDFAFVMKEVIGPKCLECHSAAGGSAGGLNLENYASVFASRVAVLDSVSDDYMPKRRTPLTARQKEILQLWISANAPEHSKPTSPEPSPTPPVVVNPEPTPAPTPDIEEPVGPSRDWLTVRTMVLEPACLRCHSAPANRGGVNLETYQNVISDIFVIDQVIRDGSMPIRTTLSAEQKELILDWIQKGAPEFAQP